MKRLTIEAIRERAKKATQGATPEWYEDEDYRGIVRCSWSGDLIAQGIPTNEDTEFIANARQDIPALLAEVERLNKRLDKAESLLSEAHDWLDDTHGYDSDVYHAISKYFNGEEGDANGEG